MSKLKLTKTELKTQSDALKQYRRFLPTLQLKKQQLQVELRKSRDLVEANRSEYAALRQELERFVGLYADAGVLAQKVPRKKITEIEITEIFVAP